MPGDILLQYDKRERPRSGRSLLCKRWGSVVLYVILHRIGQIAVRPQLIAGHIACGSCKKARNPVYDGSAGMLYGSGLDNVELGIGLAAYPPVTHIAVLRAVYLAYGLLLDGDALHGLYGHYCRHAYAVAGLDGLAEGGAVYIMIYYIRHMLLIDGLDGKSQLVADGFTGVHAYEGSNSAG